MKNKKLALILFISAAIWTAVFYQASKIERTKPTTPLEHPAPSNPTSSQPAGETGTYRVTEENKVSAVNIPNIQKATLQIEETRHESEIKEGASIYDLMSKLRSEGKINFKEKDYPGMGKFIEEINGRRGGADTYWVYYVNEKKAQIGISNYKLSPGDVVSWKLEKGIN